MRSRRFDAKQLASSPRLASCQSAWGETMQTDFPKMAELCIPSFGCRACASDLSICTIVPADQTANITSSRCPLGQFSVAMLASVAVSPLALSKSRFKCALHPGISLCDEILIPKDF